ncbi:peptidylprolyl isomerase [Clostridium botulinum]|nr:peptidylprolyl isomerase [Clostridium botulinum]NFR14781.1 peptidylprolyl isomerase [Clostridium botulinum]NFR44763.1 peptidylprolyl isomerase [Clostridium botulinum]NFS51618.1 peptidylprolyl isomerase [Clostridium botulinum]
MDENNLSVKEMLAEVDKAIYKVLVGGQSYKIGSRQLTRADLKMLKEMKDDLMAQVAQNESNLLDDTYVAVFSGR